MKFEISMRIKSDPYELTATKTFDWPVLPRNGDLFEPVDGWASFTVDGVFFAHDGSISIELADSRETVEELYRLRSDLSASGWSTQHHNWLSGESIPEEQQHGE